MIYALGSNLILSTEYGSSRSKTHIPKVLDPYLSSYAVQSRKKSGGAVGVHGHWFQLETCMNCCECLKNLLKMSKFLDHYILKKKLHF